MIELYSSAMQILRKWSECTDNEINLFQDLIDDFFQKYIKETGVEGMTNYIHMLGSGHIKYYMELHRNLYKFSQQGWESLNSKYKQFFAIRSKDGIMEQKQKKVKYTTYLQWWRYFKENCFGYLVMHKNTSLN